MVVWGLGSVLGLGFSGLSFYLLWFGACGVVLEFFGVGALYINIDE